MSRLWESLKVSNPRTSCDTLTIRLRVSSRLLMFPRQRLCAGERFYTPLIRASTREIVLFYTFVVIIAVDQSCTEKS
jgi:hypothetical protein